jgi:hypothetical protein
MRAESLHDLRPKRRSIGEAWRCAALLALAVMWLGRPAPARAIAGDSDGAFGIDGSLRLIGMATANYDVSGERIGPRADGATQGQLRLVVAGHPVTWLKYEAHVLQLANAQTRLRRGRPLFDQDTAWAGPITPAVSLRYRSVDDRWQWFDGKEVNAELQLDRLNVKLVLPFVDITLGRQAIGTSTPGFWNPLDVFLPFAPTSFDRDYRRGVDALRVDVPLGDLSQLTAIAALGRPEDGHVGYRSAFLLRGRTTIYDWDFSVQGGKIYGGMHAGIGACGELGPVALRAQASYFWPIDELRPQNAQEMPRGLTAMAGVGYSQSVLDRTLHFEAEYYFNNQATELPLFEGLALVQKGLLLQAREHYLGAMTSYELTPLLTVELRTVFGLSDPALLLQPNLVYSAADEVDVVAGALVLFGDRPTLDFATGDLAPKSELGDLPHVFYVETKIYF